MKINELDIEEYKPDHKVFMIRLIRELNNGKYGYLNM